MKKIILICLVILLSACSFRSPQSQFYVMNSTGINSLSDKTMSVAVNQIEVPDMLDKSQMVVYDEDTAEVQIMEFHRWAEVLPEIIQTTVTNDLIAYLPNAYVKRANYDNKSLQYNINIEINDLKAYTDDKVVLSAWWSICDKNGKVLKREQRTYTAKVQKSGMQALVEAQAEAVHQMTRDIAGNLLQI